MSEEDKAFLQSACDTAMAMIEDMNTLLQEGLKKLEEAEVNYMFTNFREIRE